MRKYRPHILVFVFLGIFFFSGAREVFAQEEGGWLWKLAGGTVLDTVSTGLGIVAYLVMKFMYWVTMFTGLILNAVVYHTVVQMAVYLENLKAIDVTWTLIRDVANMGFIFMLLYASIMTIIGKGGEYKGLIVKMIIAAILINFSLFFTKVIIDIANLLALTFYGAITPIAKLDEFWTGGIANGITDALGIQGFGSLAQPGATTALATMIMVTVTLLVASFVFLAAAVMFLIRYVVLIITLILSPVMFLAGVFPQLRKVHERWWGALFGQAFFAPVFFLLMWITLTLIQDVSSGVFLGGNTGSLSGAINDFENTVGMVPLFINFAIIISFVVLSLIISKQVADSAGKESQNLTKWAMGKAGSATFGTAGFFGRKSIGAIGNRVSQNNQLIERADKGATRFGRASARLALYASRKAASGSFDVRNATIPTESVGDLVRGTVGKTKIGRTIGADDLRTESIEIGRRAASITGIPEGQEKGYKELEKEKKDRLRKESIDNAKIVKDAQDKVKIENGANIARTTTEDNRTPDQETSVKDLVDIMKKVSEKEIENQKFEVLVLQEVAEALSQKQIEAIEKSPNFTPEEIQKIKNSRGQRINEAFTAGSNPMPHARPGPTGAVPTGHEKAMEMMRKMNYSEIAKMDKTKLTDPGILEIYTPKFLDKLRKVNELTDEKATAIRDEINRVASLPTASAQIIDTATWLAGPGLNIF